MSRLSRGCLRCRQRKVKCDEGKPACNRCVQRGEICEGYRDETSLIFRYENKKVEKQIKRRGSEGSLGSGSGSGSSLSTSWQSSSYNSSSYVAGSQGSGDRSLKPLKTKTRRTTSKASEPLLTPQPWLKAQVEDDDAVVNMFFDGFVLNPASKNSSPGFLEQLPMMFREVPINNKTALRWAVHAASYASLHKKKGDPETFECAMRCYGLALKCLSKGLTERLGPPDDFLLMTVIVLDIFEAIHFGTSPNRKGQHAEAMKQILRLRGESQMYSARGWSLFRLSHHRIQQQQLTHRQPAMEESAFWLQSLNDELPEVQVERANHEYVQACNKANQLLMRMSGPGVPAAAVLDLVREVHALDDFGTTWRHGPSWEYRVISRSTLDETDPLVASFPVRIELHTDLWIAYEWNYYRAARMMTHSRLVEVVAAAGKLADASIASEITYFIDKSKMIISQMADEIHATAPQSLGDIDRNGKLIKKSPDTEKTFRGIGAYFLLWPVKVIKYDKNVPDEQKEMSLRIIERIRDETGMRQTLGEHMSRVEQ